MKLYYSKGACSLAVRISIHEMGLQSEYESVNLKTKKTEKDEDYLQINSKGAVPLLQLDNHTKLTENIAIQEYLADTSHQLLPEIGNLKRYRVIEWLGFINSDLHKSFGAFFNPTFSDEMKTNVFTPMLKKKLEVVEKHLQNYRYVIGDEFTIADSYLYVVLRWLPLAKIDENEYPNIQRYKNTVQERKAVQEALKEEELL